MFTHNITIAWRNIRKYLMQNIISVIGLTASLICFSIYMHFIRFELEQYDTVEKRDRIVKIYAPSDKTSFLSRLGCADAAKLKSLQLNTLSGLCIVKYRETTGYLEGRTGKNLPYKLTAIETDSLFASFFNLNIVAGSWEQVAHHPNSIVLTASAARRIFGSEDEAIGQTLNRNEAVYANQTYTVRAVMEDWDSQKSDAVCSADQGFDLLRVNDLAGAIERRENRGPFINVYGMMADGCSVEDVNRELLTVVTHFPFIWDMERGDHVLKGYLMGERTENEIIWPWFMFIGLSLLVLSVGLFNFLHFLIGTFLNRTHEYSLRRLMGCRWRDLFLMLMTQMSIMVIAVGWLCNYVLRWLDVRAIVPQSMFTPDIDRGKLMLEAAEYTGWIFLLCTLICLVISWRIHRITIQRGILGNTAAPRHQRRVSRNLLLGFQFFASWLFICFAVASYMISDLNRNKVFDTLTNDEKEQILSVSLNPGLVSISFQEKPFVCQRLAAHSGVKEMMPHSFHLFGGSGSDHFFLYDNLENENACSYPSIDAVPKNFFEFMNIELIRGNLPEKEGEVVVNKHFADNFAEDVIGKSFYRRDVSLAYKVTGIVNNFISHNTGRGTNPETLYSVDIHQPMISQVYLKCYPGQVEAVREHVRQELRKVFPENVEPEITTLMEDIEDSHGGTRSLQPSVNFLSIVCLTIALLGVYSAITLDTERRRKEVAVRKVFGARFGNILWMFGRRYFWLLVIPALLAFPIDYLVLYSLSMNYVEFIYIGPFFWLGIFLAVSLLVLLTILWRILQVAHIRPAEEIAKG